METWKQKILELAGQFTLLDSQYIYREYNLEVDELSKMHLNLQEGGTHDY